VIAAFPAATRAIQRSTKEKVPNVFQAGLQVLSTTVLPILHPLSPSGPSNKLLMTVNHFSI